jgi:hypothetical protein
VLKTYAKDEKKIWNRARRRHAWDGLAVFASLLRRLIHLMARAVPLAPIHPDTDGSAPRAPPGPGLRLRPRLAFRLIETAQVRRRQPQNPAHVPDTPAFDRARFLDRLSALARVYRERERLARRLARRVQSGRAPLRARPLPKQVYPRVHPAFSSLLDTLSAVLRGPAIPDSS